MTEAIVSSFMCFVCVYVCVCVLKQQGRACGDQKRIESDDWS